VTATTGREPVRAGARRRPLAVSVVLALLAPSAGSAQVADAGPPRDVVETLTRVTGTITGMGAELGPSIWPGFRPDTIPVRYVIPDVGAVVANWGAPLPDGYELLGETGLGWQPVAEAGAASTGIALAGRAIAQVVVRDAGYADLVGTAVHEAFHVYSWSKREDGHWFGTGENSFLVTSYPVFDVENEHDVILEGRLLLDALGATSPETRNRTIEQFLAVRESRHRRLGHELARFEAAGEMNEGLAEYALVRAREAVGEDVGTASSILRLENLAGEPERSIRLRFYSTGPAMALLLDRLANGDWKDRLVVGENLDLQDALASAVGYRAEERRRREAALAGHHAADIRRLARERAETLGATRRARADSILSEPGVLVVVSMARSGGTIGLCGIDPQNLLQGPDGVLLHTRWLRPCAGSALSGELNTPAVQDREAATLSAVAGAEADVHLSVGGQEVRLADGDELLGAQDVVIQSDRLTLTSAKADVRRRGRRLELSPVPG